MKADNQVDAIIASGLATLSMASFNHVLAGVGLIIAIPIACYRLYNNILESRIKRLKLKKLEIETNVED